MMKRILKDTTVENVLETASKCRQHGIGVIFSFIVFKSRAHRDKVNGAVMKDPKLAAMMKEGEVMPFDCTRMIYGGFEVLVEA